MVDGVVSGSKMCNCRVVLKVFNICFIGLVFLIRKDHNNCSEECCNSGCVYYCTDTCSVLNATKPCMEHH